MIESVEVKIPTKEEYWNDRKNDQVRTWTKPIPKQEYDPMLSVMRGERVWKDEAPPCLPVEEQKHIMECIGRAAQITFGGGWDLFVEVAGEGRGKEESIRFKLRQVYNEPLKRADLQTYYNLCKQVRKELNFTKMFRTCKVFMLIYEGEPEMTSLNVVYNPHWRRYENFELMYRSQVQLRRARR